MDAQSRAKDHHLYEIESLQKEFEQAKIMDQHTNNKKIKEMKYEIASLQSEIEKHVLIEGQYKEKLEQQEEMLEHAHQLNKDLQQTENLETDLEEQRQMVAELQNERDYLAIKVTKLKNTLEQSDFDKKACEEKFKSYEEEMQEKSRQSQMWYNCLHVG